METYINNNKKPEITVIIPSYNVKEYIEECLESLKNQTFTDFEVLCVDDGSNDGTADIIKEYAVSDPRFQYVSMDPVSYTHLDVYKRQLLLYIYFYI